MDLKKIKMNIQSEWKHYTKSERNQEILTKLYAYSGFVTMTFSGSLKSSKNRSCFTVKIVYP